MKVLQKNEKSQVLCFFFKLQQMEIFFRFPCLLFPFFLPVEFIFLLGFTFLLIFVCAEIHWFHKSCL